MSGFARSWNEEELRVRNAQGFAVGQTVLGTVANPLNIVFFNSMGGAKQFVLTKLFLNSSVANTAAMFSIGADPGLAAGTAPRNRHPGSGASAITYETAVAAQPATTGTYGNYILVANAQVNLLATEVYVCGGGTGILVSLPAVAGNVSWAIAWYETTN